MENSSNNNQAGASRDFNNREQFLERPLPSNTEAERAILGAILLDNNLILQVLQEPLLHPAAFYSPFHRIVFEAMTFLFDAGSKIDPILIGEYLKAQGKLESSGGVAAVANLTYGLPHFNNLDHYARLVMEKWTARIAIAAANQLVSNLLAEEDLPVVPIATVIEQLHTLIENGQAGRKPTVTVAQAMPAQAERYRRMMAGDIVTVPTGNVVIDERLTGGGWEKRMFHVAAAESGAGKTSLALDAAGFNAAQGKTVVFFSAELSTEVIMDRLLSPYSSVERWKITGRHLTGELFSRLVQTGDALSHYKLYINDRARTAAEIKTACRAIARENNHKIDLILVDYLQRLEYPFGITNQNQGITALMKELAPLAGEYDAAVVALSQFNREHEKRSDPTPRKSDLRGCGEIEEYARTILALYDPDEGKPKRAIKVACLKQGEGETFNGIDLVYDTDFMTFGGRFPLFSPVENDFYL